MLEEEIRENIRKRGYTNKLINYQEFLELYKPYKNEMGEKEFAEVLGIAYGNYMAIKNRGTKAKILKEERKVQEERKEEIRKDLKKRDYANKSIDYQEFLQLYKLYENEMEEKEFAEILGIAYGNYMAIKNKGTRAKVLKEESKIQEERKEEIRNNLRKKGYISKSIDYQEFLKLYKLYEDEMEEKEFAEILGIAYGNYMSIKNKGTRARVLKEVSKVPEERKEEIRKDLRKMGYISKSINYQEFLELYRPYENGIEEKEFAEILGMSYSNYMAIKNKGTRVKILKEERKISGERKKEITRELKIKGYANKIINYQEFLELYKLYENEMEEKEFAKILGIAYGNYMNIKNIGTRARVLKEERKVPEERKEEIRKDLRKMGYISKSIDYQEFLELYRPYENGMEEKEFAEIIGISYCNYMTIKNKGTRTKVLKYDALKTPQKTDDNEKEEISKERIVEDMKICYEKGMKNSDSIAYVRDKYGVSRKELLKILEQELGKKRRIEKSETRKVYLEEEYDDSKDIR